MTTQTLPDRKVITPELHRPSPPSRRYLGIVAVIALVVGALGGFFIGRANAPEKTVTNTVTVAAPAYSVAGKVGATVLFNGTTAAFNGPAEMKAWTNASFTLTSTEKDAVLVVGQSNVPTLTWESFSAYTGSAEPTWLQKDFTVIRAGYTVTIAMKPGLWLVSVVSFASDRSYPVTMIRVTP